MALQVFQTSRAALEAVRGTNLTPTRILYAETMAHEQDVATIKPDELRNSYNPNYSASAGPERNALLYSGRVSFDDLIWWANLFLKGVASGTGAGADKTWTFLPTAASDDVKTATIQMGYSDTIATAPGIELGYCMGESLTLHFEKNDDGAVTFDARLISPEAATQITSFTGALSDRTVVAASANGTQLFADQASAIGTTADSTFVSLDWRLNLGPVPFYTLNNSVAATNAYRPTWRRWEATLVRQFTSDLYWDDYSDKTVQKIRCRTLGPVLGGSNYKIDLDLYGVITSRRMADVEGVITEELTLSQIYDTTAAADHQLVVVNATAAIT
jgi:hypothetical protein